VRLSHFRALLTLPLPQQDTRRENPRQRNPAPLSSQESDERGLWVDSAFFRKLTTRAPQTVLHPTSEEEENYFLKLANIALGHPKEKRKADRRPTAFRKSPSQSKKPTP